MRCAPEEGEKWMDRNVGIAVNATKRTTLVTRTITDISGCGGEINGSFISYKWFCLSITNASSLSTPP